MMKLLSGGPLLHSRRRSKQTRPGAKLADSVQVRSCQKGELVDGRGRSRTQTSESNVRSRHERVKSRDFLGDLVDGRERGGLRANLELCLRLAPHPSLDNCEVEIVVLGKEGRCPLAPVSTKPKRLRPNEVRVSPALAKGCHAHRGGKLVGVPEGSDASWWSSVGELALTTMCQLDNSPNPSGVDTPAAAPGRVELQPWWTLIPYTEDGHVAAIRKSRVSLQTRAPQPKRQRIARNDNPSEDLADWQWLADFESTFLVQNECPEELPVDGKPHRRVTRDGGHEECKTHETIGLLGGARHRAPEDTWQDVQTDPCGCCTDTITGEELRYQILCWGDYFRGWSDDVKTWIRCGHCGLLRLKPYQLCTIVQVARVLGLDVHPKLLLQVEADYPTAFKALPSADWLPYQPVPGDVYDMAEGGNLCELQRLTPEQLHTLSVALRHKSLRESAGTDSIEFWWRQMLKRRWPQTPPGLSWEWQPLRGIVPGSTPEEMTQPPFCAVTSPVSDTECKELEDALRRCNTCGQVLKRETTRGTQTTARTPQAEARKGYAGRKARKTCPECGQPVDKKRGQGGKSHPGCGRPVTDMQLNGNNGSATNTDDVEDMRHELVEWPSVDEDESSSVDQQEFIAEENFSLWLTHGNLAEHITQPAHDMAAVVQTPWTCYVLPDYNVLQEFPDSPYEVRFIYLTNTGPRLQIVVTSCCQWRVMFVSGILVLVSDDNENCGCRDFLNDVEQSNTWAMLRQRNPVWSGPPPRRQMQTVVSNGARIYLSETPLHEGLGQSLVRHRACRTPAGGWRPLQFEHNAWDGSREVRQMSINGSNGSATDTDDVSWVRKTVANQMLRAALQVHPAPLELVTRPAPSGDVEAPPRRAQVQPGTPVAIGVATSSPRGQETTSSPPTIVSLDREVTLVKGRVSALEVWAQVVGEMAQNATDDQNEENAIDDIMRDYERASGGSNCDLLMTYIEFISPFIAALMLVWNWATVYTDSDKLYLSGVGVFRTPVFGQHSWYADPNVEKGLEEGLRWMVIYFSWQWVYCIMAMISNILAWRRGFKTFILLSTWVTTIQMWWVWTRPGSWGCCVTRVVQWSSGYMYLIFMTLHMFLAVPNRVRRYGVLLRDATDPWEKLVRLMGGRSVRSMALNGNNGSATNTDDVDDGKTSESKPTGDSKPPAGGVPLVGLAKSLGDRPLELGGATRRVAEKKSETPTPGEKHEPSAPPGDIKWERQFPDPPVQEVDGKSTDETKSAEEKAPKRRSRQSGKSPQPINLQEAEALSKALDDIKSEGEALWSSFEIAILDDPSIVLTDCGKARVRVIQRTLAELRLCQDYGQAKNLLETLHTLIKRFKGRDIHENTRNVAHLGPVAAKQDKLESGFSKEESSSNGDAQQVPTGQKPHTMRSDPTVKVRWLSLASQTWSSFWRGSSATVSELMFTPHKRVSRETDQDYHDVLGEPEHPSIENCTVGVISVAVNGIETRVGHVAIFPGTIITQHHVVVNSQGDICPMEWRGKRLRHTFADAKLDLVVYGHVPTFHTMPRGRVFVVSTVGVLSGTVRSDGGQVIWAQGKPGWSGSPIFTEGGAFVGCYGKSSRDKQDRRFIITDSIPTPDDIALRGGGNVVEVREGLGTGKSTKKVAGIVAARGRTLLVNPNVATVRALYDWHSKRGGYSVAARAGHVDKFEMGDLEHDDLVIMTYDSADMLVMRRPKFITSFKAIVVDESHEPSSWTNVFHENQELPSALMGVQVTKMTATPQGVGFELPRTPKRINFIQVHDALLPGNLPEPTGNRLHFVATKAEAKEVTNAYTTKGILAHSCVSDNKEMALKWFSETEGIKVLVATNTVRSGITLDIVECVDPGDEVVAWIDQNGRRHIQRRNTSPWSSVQRMGRVGRFQEGIVFYDPQKCGRGPDSVVDHNIVVRSECLTWALQQVSSHPYIARIRNGQNIADIASLVSVGIPPVEAMKASSRAGFTWKVYANLRTKPYASDDVDPNELLQHGWPTDDSYFVSDYTGTQRVLRETPEGKKMEREILQLPDTEQFSVVNTALLFGTHALTRVLRVYQGTAVVRAAERASVVMEDCKPRLDPSQLQDAAHYTKARPEAERLVGDAITTSNAYSVAGTLSLIMFTTLGAAFGSITDYVFGHAVPFVVAILVLFHSLTVPSKINIEGNDEVIQWVERHYAALLAMGALVSVGLIMAFGKEKEMEESRKEKIAKKHSSAAMWVSLAVIGLIFLMLWMNVMGLLPREFKPFVKLVASVTNNSADSLILTIVNFLRAVLTLIEDVLGALAHVAEHTDQSAYIPDWDAHVSDLGTQAYTLYKFLFNTWHLTSWFFSVVLGFSTSLTLTYQATYERIEDMEETDMYRELRQPKKIERFSFGFVGWLVGSIVGGVFAYARHLGPEKKKTAFAIAQRAKADNNLGATLAFIGRPLKNVVPDPKELEFVSTALRWLISPPVAYVTNFAVAELGTNFTFGVVLFTALQIVWEGSVAVALILWGVAIYLKYFDSQMLAWVTTGMAFATAKFGTFSNGNFMSKSVVADPRAIQPLLRNGTFVSVRASTMATGLKRLQANRVDLPEHRNIRDTAWAEAMLWIKDWVVQGYQINSFDAVRYLPGFPRPNAVSRNKIGDDHDLADGDNQLFLLSRQTYWKVGKFEQVSFIRPLSDRGTMFVWGLNYKASNRAGMPSRVWARLTNYEPVSFLQSFLFYYKDVVSNTMLYSVVATALPEDLNDWRKRRLAAAEVVLSKIDIPEMRDAIRRVVRKFDDSLDRSLVFFSEVINRHGPCIPHTFGFETGMLRVLGKCRAPVPSKQTETRYSRTIDKVLKNQLVWDRLDMSARAYTDHQSFWNGFVDRFVRPVRFSHVPKQVRWSVRRHVRLCRKVDLVKPGQFEHYNHRSGAGMMTANLFPGPMIRWANDAMFQAFGLNYMAGREAFPKNEKRTKAMVSVNWEKFLPRAIVMLEGAARYMNHMFDGITHQVYGWETSGIGMDPFQIAEWLGRCHERGWSFMSNDIKRWDASQNLVTRAIAWTYHLACNDSDRVAKACADGVWCPVFHQNGWITAAEAPTNTGDWDTSASNTSINSTMLSAAVWDALGEDLHSSDKISAKIVGDDNILVGSRSTLLRCVESIRNTYEPMGLELDEESLQVHDVPWTATFCSHGALPAGGFWWPCRRAETVMARLRLCGKNEITDLRNAATGYFLLYYGIPHVREMCREIIKHHDRAVLSSKDVARLSGFVKFESLTIVGDLIDKLEAVIVEMGRPLNPQPPNELLEELGYDWDPYVVAAEVGEEYAKLLRFRK